MSEAVPSDKKEVLRYLWARKRVETLTDYGFSSNDKAVKAEITKIGLQYSMMTPYTSFAAVLDTVRNPDGTSKDVDQPSPLPKGVSELALVGHMLGSEPGDFLLILALTLVSGMGYFENRRKKEKLMKIKRYWISCFFVFLVAAGLRYFYGNAGSDRLIWLLAPTTRWVSFLSGLDADAEDTEK